MKENALTKTEENPLEKTLVKNNSSERFQTILRLVFSFKNEHVVDSGLAQKYQTSANYIRHEMFLAIFRMDWNFESAQIC